MMNSDSDPATVTSSTARGDVDSLAVLINQVAMGDDTALETLYDHTCLLYTSDAADE